MIKIIDGKRYNTDTAEQVFFHSNSHSRSDFKYRSKALYRTQNGAWFIHNEGGAMTDMAERVGNNTLCGGESIEVLTDADVFGFLQAHSNDSEAEALIDTYFADRVEEA